MTSVWMTKTHAQTRQAYADQEGKNQVVRGPGDVAYAIHQKTPGPETGESGNHRHPPIDAEGLYQLDRTAKLDP